MLMWLRKDKFGCIKFGAVSTTKFGHKTGFVQAEAAIQALEEAYVSKKQQHNLDAGWQIVVLVGIATFENLLDAYR